MSSNFFRSVTYFPDGQVYDSSIWAISELRGHCPPDISQFLTLDSKRRSETISSPIGNLGFVWSASDVFGVSTLLRNGVMINAGLFLPGVDAKEELELLEFYLDSWRGFDVVKELSGGETPFRSAEAIKERPLLVSVNWAAISKEDYDHVAYYDVFIACEYFHKVYLSRGL